MFLVLTSIICKKNVLMQCREARKYYNDNAIVNLYNNIDIKRKALFIGTFLSLVILLEHAKF